MGDEHLENFLKDLEKGKREFNHLNLGNKDLVGFVSKINLFFYKT